MLQSADCELRARSLNTVVNRNPGLQAQLTQEHDYGMLQPLKAVSQKAHNPESTTENIRGEHDLANLHSVMDSGASKLIQTHPNSWMQCLSAYSCR